MKKKVLLLFLCLLTVVQTFAQLGVGQQVGNNDFEQWEGSSSSIEPVNWNSLVAQSTNNGLLDFIAGQGRKQAVWKETSDMPTNTTGSACVKLKAFSVLGIVANGNITTGCINLGSSSATNTKNCSYTKKGDASLSESFTAKPDYVYFWAKTVLSNNSHKARINAVIHNDVVSNGAYNNACYQDPSPTSSSNSNVGTGGTENEAKVVAKATENFNTSGVWVQKQVAFDYATYASNNAQAKYILITLSTNQTAGTGTNGDLFYLDDIVMVYDARLATLKINGNTVTGFQAPGNTKPAMVDTATVVMNMDWCASTPLPTPTFTCKSQWATATITHAATAQQPYTIITVDQSGVTKKYRINYNLINVAAPVVSTPDANCGTAASVTLSATPAQGTTCRWYDGNSTLLGSNNSYTATNVASTTTFYVSSYQSSPACESSKTPVVVTINPTYNIPEAITICERELPYTWRGEQLVAGGTHQKTYQTVASGCDSTYTLTLTVIPYTRIDDEDISICPGSTTTWRGKTLSAAGTYYDTVANNSNCFDIHKVVVTERPTYITADPAVTVHQHDLPYSWRGEQLMEEGIHRKIYQTAVYGCDSIYTINLTVIPYNYHHEEENIEMCEGESTTWRGNTIEASGTYYDTVRISNRNYTIYSVDAIFYPSYYIEQNVTVCEADLPYEWQGESITEEVVNYEVYYYTEDLGCDSIYSLTLNITPYNRIDDEDISICQGGNANWRGKTLSAAGTYYDTVANNSNCYDIYKVRVNVRPTYNYNQAITICESETPYSWRGQRLTESGIYYDSLQTRTYGCDSVYKLELTVTPYNRIHNEDIHLCQGGRESWRGQTITAAGTYRDTVPNNSSCYDIYDVTVYVHPTYIFRENATVCEHDLPYEWRGQSLRTSNTYYDSLQTVTYGCDSVYSLALTVTPYGRIHNTDIDICEGGSASWRGKTLSAAGTYYDTVAAGNCYTIYDVTVYVHPTYAFEEDLTICESQVPYSWHGMQLTQSDVYYKEYKTATYQCDSTYTLNLTITPYNRIDDEDINICQGGNASWRGKTLSAAGTYYDTVANNDACYDIHKVRVTVRPTYNFRQAITVCESETPYAWRGQQLTASGTYNDSLQTVTYGCDSVYTLTLTVTPYNRIHSDDIHLCQGGRESWRGQTLTAAGTYRDTVPNASSCYDIYDVTVYVHPTYIFRENATVCEYDLPYEWRGQSLRTSNTYYDSLQTVTYGCDSVYSLVLTVTSYRRIHNDDLDLCQGSSLTWRGKTITEGGTYYDTVPYNTCYAIYDVTVNEHPSYNIPEEITICESELPYEWRGLQLNAADEYTKTYKTTTYECDSTYTLTLTVTPYNRIIDNEINICQGETTNWRGKEINVAGTYYDTVPNNDQCFDIYQVRVNVRPTYSFTENTTICESETPFAWRNLQFTESGTYRDSLQTATYGCDSVYTLNLVVTPYNRIHDNPIDLCEGSSTTWRQKELTEAGTYYDTVANNNSCYDIYDVTVVTHPTYNIPEELTICESQLPYSWRGMQLSEGGEYTKTYTTATYGCDSTCTLTLTVTPYNRIIDNDIDICQGGYASWRGQTLTVAGTYYDTIPNDESCYDIYQVRLNVHPTYSFTENTTVCENELPYQWHNLSLTESGTYRDSLQTATYGCDSVYTLNLTVADFGRYVENDIIICEGSSALWRNYVLTEAGIYRDTVNNGSGCSNIYEVTLIVAQPYEIPEVLTVCESELPYSWHGQQLTENGVYKDSLLTVNNCDSVYVLTFTVTPYTRIHNDDIVLCEGESAQWRGMTLTEAGHYYDTIANANSCYDIYDVEVIVNPTYIFSTPVTVCESELPYVWRGRQLMATDIYRDSLQTTVTGCDSIYELNLTVTPYTRIHNDDIVLCEGESAEWQNQTIAEAGHYYDTVANNNNCYDIYDVEVIVNPKYYYNEILTICESQVPYTWHGQRLTENGVYKDSLLTVNSCDSVYELNLTVTPYNRIHNDDIVLCQGASAEWQGKTLSTAGHYYDTVANNDNCYDIYDVTVRVNPTYIDREATTICESELPYEWRGQQLMETGVYNDTLPTMAGCDSIFTFALTVTPYNRIQSDDIVLCQGERAQWRNRTLTETGHYYDTVANANSCYDIYDVEVIVNPTYAYNNSVTICESELPYEWRGRELTETGIYRDSLQTVEGGCDSVYALTLNIVSFRRIHNDDIVLCEGNSAEWQGQTLSEAGQYFDTVPNNNNCYDIYDVTVIVHPSYEMFDTITICEGELPYAWRGQRLETAGDHSSSYTTTTYACDSIYNLNLNVIPFNRIHEDDIVLCQGASEQWRGRTLSAAGHYYDTIPNDDNCYDIYDVTVRVNPNFSNREVMTICEYDLPYVWHGQELNETGIYTDSLQTVLGCDSIYTLSLTVTPFNRIHDDNISLCENESAEWRGMTLNETGHYYDTIVNNSNCFDIYDVEVMVNSRYEFSENVTVCEGVLPYEWHGQELNEVGTYTDSLTTAAGCDSIFTINFNISDYNRYTDNDIVICEGTSAEWRDMFLTEAGQYQDTVMMETGCSSIYEVNVRIAQHYADTTDLTVCERELPYTWNGRQLTEAGTYVDSLQTVNSCDSIITLNFNVNNYGRFTEQTIALCDGTDTIWHNMTLSEAGTYYDTIPNNDNCYDIYEVSVVVNPSYAFADTTVVCESELPYEWRGQSLMTTGTYTDALRTEAGCDSLYTLAFTVTPYNHITNDNIVICRGENAEWRGMTITEAGTYYDTVANDINCYDIYEVTVIVNPTYANTEVVAACESELPYEWHGMSLTESGTYVDSLQTVRGCDSIIMLNFTVSDFGRYYDNDIVICEGANAEWHGMTIAEAGTYTDTINTPSGCSNIYTVTVIVAQHYADTTDLTVCESELPYVWQGQELMVSGTYTDSLRTINGCDSILTLNLTISAFGRITEDDIEICAGDAATWHGMTLTDAGTYYDTIVNPAGCSDIYEVTLVVNPVYASSEDTTICESALPYEWHGMSLTESGIYVDSLQTLNGCDSIITMNFNVNAYGRYTEQTITLCDGDSEIWHNMTLSEAGTYFDTIPNNDNCYDIYEVNVVINPTFALTEDATVCESELPYEWHGMSLNESGTYVDSLQTISGCDSIITLNFNVNAYGRITDETIVLCQGETAIWNEMELSEAGTYVDTIASDNNCYDIHEVTVVVNPTYEFQEEALVCPTSLPYEWRGQLLDETGIYVDSLTTETGCDSLYIINFTVAPSYDIYVIDTVYTNELYENYGISNIFTDTTTVSFEFQELTFDGCDSIINLTIVVLYPEGIQEMNITGKVTIYPNPADEYMTIEAEGIQMKEITLFDNAGRKVLQQNVDANIITLNVQHFATGIYVLQINTDNGLLRKKVIIQ